MVASLDGIIFSQFYGDNSGGAEFDTDGDGTATQEDEFVSLQNTSGTAVDLSGWQIWSDMAGTGAPDGSQDGLYHTFPPGTVIDPGATLYIINEITGTPAYNMQEASAGGVESGAGGVNTNFLSEGTTSGSESLALVNPATGEYIVLNFSGSNSSLIPSLSGFPGTTSVGESNAATDTGVEDQNAGSSYQYDPGTDAYVYNAVYISCFASGTSILTPDGPVAVERLKPGDLIETLDNGAQPLRWAGKTHLDRAALDRMPRARPVLIPQGVLENSSDLLVSPQHCVLLGTRHGLDRPMLARAKHLAELPGPCRIAQGVRQVTYHHLLLPRHEIIFANGVPTESFYPGAQGLRALPPAQCRAILAAIPGFTGGSVERAYGPRARQVLRRRELIDLLPLRLNRGSTPDRAA